MYELISKQINGRTLFEDITEIIQNGQYWYCWAKWSWKDNILNILSGEDNDYTGTLKIIGQTVKVAYFKQTEETLDRDIRG